jgi:hypothetical protein
MRRTLALALLLAAAVPAGAATFVAPSVEEMARSSDLVVRGRVLGTAARALPGGRIVTEVEVQVDADGAWKGAPASTVRFVVPGGRAGRIAMKVDAAPSFSEGEDVVVFLSRVGPGWRVNGHALGKYRVEGAEARPAVEGSRLLERGIGAGERRVGVMPVAELERRVRAAR